MTIIRTATAMVILGVALAITGCRASPLAATATATPESTALPTESVTRVPPTPTQVFADPISAGPTWQDLPLISKSQALEIPNETEGNRRKEIYGSQIVLDADTRWIIDVQIKRLTPISDVVGITDVGTGIVLRGLGDKGKFQSLLLVYHSGKWAMGVTQTGSESQFEFWQEFENLTSPRQHFELLISADGQRLGLKNDQGFTFDWSMPDKPFASPQGILTQAQIAAQTRLTLSQLSVQQLRNSQPSNSTASTPPNGMPTPIAPPLGVGHAEYIFHVAVNGSDDNPGTADEPFASLEHARNAVRAISPNMRGPIIVYLHGGFYFIDHAIQFGPLDSGQNGNDIIYRAAPGETPVLSGGISVGDWQKLPDGPMWKAKVNGAADFRQLYVNGVRARRAASEQPVTGRGWAGGAASGRDGIIMAAGQMPVITRSQNLELHWIYDWKDMRLPVTTTQIFTDGTQIIWMRQPYFARAISMGTLIGPSHQWFPKYTVPFYLENALELLDQPGEWYYNSDSEELVYWPRPGEDLTTADVMIPQTQSLVEIAGTQVGQEVHNLTFDGLTFAYAGWTRANDVGTFGWQAQQLITGTVAGKTGYEMTPGHVQVTYAHDIRITGSRFEHLGAAALSLGHGASHITVQGNLFHDISDSAVVVGHWDDVYITAPAIQAAPHDNLIADNLIHEIGAEYWGAPAITAYYVSGLQILHNEISDIPFSGISVGWGWSAYADSTTSRANHIAYNLITNLNLRARDGGGIYTLGQQPQTIVEQNVIRNVASDFACLYPDEGSAFITFRNNVCDTAPRWLHIWTPNIHDVQVADTYTNVPELRNDGTNIDIQNTVSVTEQAWPAEAQAIIDQAGLGSAYVYLRTWLVEK